MLVLSAHNFIQMKKMKRVPQKEKKKKHKNQIMFYLPRDCCWRPTKIKIVTFSNNNIKQHQHQKKIMMFCFWYKNARTIW